MAHSEVGRLEIFLHFLGMGEYFCVRVSPSVSRWVGKTGVFRRNGDDENWSYVQQRYPVAVDLDHKSTFVL